MGKGKKWFLKRKKMVLFIGDSWRVKQEQQTGETETGDECNKNSELAKLEQQTSDRQNSGLSEPNSEWKPVCQVFK